MERADPDPFRAPVLVFSSGPARYLTGLGYAARLALLSQLTVPRTVLEQLARLHPQLAARLHAIPNLFVSEPQRPSAEQARRAGITEAGAVAGVGLALEYHGVPVLDEPADQRGAARLGLPLANSLGLLGQVHSVGLGVRNLRQDLLWLKRAGFALSPRLLKAVDSGTPADLRRALAADAVRFDWTAPGARRARLAASDALELEQLER